MKFYLNHNFTESFPKNLHLLVYVYVCISHTHIWKSEGHFQELVLLFHDENPRDQIHAARRVTSRYVPQS